MSSWLKGLVPITVTSFTHYPTFQPASISTVPINFNLMYYFIQPVHFLVNGREKNCKNVNIYFREMFLFFQPFIRKDLFPE
jgi:hypothetical protein